MSSLKNGDIVEEVFKKRIGYTGDVEDISRKICEDYELGEFKSNDIILAGYEDFNFILETVKGKYFVKLFALFRSVKDCQRYVDVIDAAIKAGVSTPKMYEVNDSFFYQTNVGGADIRLIVMEHINGKTFLERDDKLSPEEAAFVAEQTAIVHSMDIKPEFVYDTWAITSFLKEYEKRGEYLTSKDAVIVGELVEKFKTIDFESLPHCFVHGDIIASNPMKDANGKLWIIDFAVANWYPRIQELAVLGCNLFMTDGDEETTERNLDSFLKQYQKLIKLTQEELNVLPLYIKFAHAMHVLRANYEKVYENNSSEENEYWLKQGRIGLGLT